MSPLAFRDIMHIKVEWHGQTGDSMASERTCPDCNSEIDPIQVVDQLGGGKLRPLSYTREAKPKTSSWSGALKNQDGVLDAYLCRGCQRVFFYGRAT